MSPCSPPRVSIPRASCKHPKLNSLAGSRILLIKGSDGRELLQQELARRGAQVTVADVYRRERAKPSAAELSALEAHFAAGAIQVITATSVEIAGNLLELATPASAQRLRARALGGAGRAHRPELARAGAVGALLQADSAEDQDLVAAIVRWRASESGA